MAAAPVFAATPKVGMVQIATANTARDGSGTVGTVLTGGTNGSKIEEIRIINVGTITAGIVRLFLYDGTNSRLFSELAFGANTPSATVPAIPGIVYYTNLWLPSNAWQLRASTHLAEVYNVFAFYEDI